MKLLIHHSGSVYSGPHPENVLHPANVMMSYWEIKRGIAKQDKRFGKVEDQRHANDKGRMEEGSAG